MTHTPDLLVGLGAQKMHLKRALIDSFAHSSRRIVSAHFIIGTCVTPRCGAKQCTDRIEGRSDYRSRSLGGIQPGAKYFRV